MNPFDLDATGLLVWGLVAHLIADWGLQNSWMAKSKAERRTRWGSHKDGRELTGDEIAAQTGAVKITAYGNTYGALPSRWWDRNPAAYVHAGIHGLALAFVFGWVAVPLAVVHLVIDTRAPVVWWARLIRQDAPRGDEAVKAMAKISTYHPRAVPLFDVGALVRMAVDQVFHVLTIAAAALLVTLI